MPTVWALVDVRGEDGELHGDVRRIRLPDPVSPEVQAVGRRLAWLRRTARLTLYEMYQRALIPVARLSDIERGYVVATAEELAAIARVLQAGPEEG